jgi:hypothetical protein
VPEAGVPAKAAVPFILLTNVIPDGNAPVSPKVGMGAPDAINVYVPATPTVNALGLLELERVAAVVVGTVWVDPPPAPQPASTHARNPEMNRKPSLRPRGRPGRVPEKGTHVRPIIVCTHIIRPCTARPSNRYLQR